MPGLKKYHPEFDSYRSGITRRDKVTQDEVDQYKYTKVIYPSTSASWFGTAAAGSSGQAKAFVMLNQQADYPRTPLVTVTNSSGSICAGSAYLVGTNQFGQTITETIALSGTETTTAAGTHIYKTITAGTVTFGTATEEDGTATLGVAVGTTAGVECWFGLGYRLGATSDVKMITWVDNATLTGLNKGTTNSSLVSATTHSFAGTKNLAITDIYIVQALPTYNAEYDATYIAA